MKSIFKNSLSLLSLFALLFFFLFFASCSLNFNNGKNSEGFSGLNHAATKATSFNYADAFAKSILMYDVNWCGPDAGSNRLPWRGPCHTSDGADVGLDLSGGFHDCGDHVKFGQTQCYSAATLGWAYYEFKDVFVAKGQDAYLLKVLKHFTDYFLKCFPNANTFYYQCGDGATDHPYWGPPELQTLSISTRPTLYSATPTAPGSDVCGDAAAALALMYLDYKDKDSAYASKCLTAAQGIYTLGKTYPGLSQSGGFYGASIYLDDLSWGALWLYMATSNSTYMTDISNYLVSAGISEANQYANSWTYCWDNVWAGVFVKLAQITNRGLYKYCADYNMNYWVSNISRTPGGFCFLNSWGNCRYVSAQCMLAMVYNKTVSNQAYVDFTKSQIDYILGNNPLSLSYECGFGTNYPHFPHNRAASGRFEYPPANEHKTDPERHLPYGFLVGGPDANDNFSDDPNNFVFTEGGIDYNAGFVGALAGMTAIYGMSQTPEATPGIESTNSPYYISAYVASENNQGSTIYAYLNNISVLPPHYETNLSFRYFVNLSEYFSTNSNVTSAVTCSVYYGPTNAVVSVLQPWDAANGIYYIEASAPNSLLYGKVPFEFSLHAYDYTCWNPSNDFSRTGLTTATNDVMTVYIPVYRNGVLIYGNEPPKGGSSSSTASSTAVSSSRAASSIAASSSLAASSVASSAAVSSSRSSAASSAAVSSSRSSAASSTAVSSSRASSVTSSAASSAAVSSSRAVSSAASSVAVSSTAASSGGYAVNYAVNNDWGAGATVTVTIKNNSTTAVNGWTLVWTYAGNQAITQIWNATQTSSGETITVNSLSYSGTIGANGGTQSFGFNLSYSGTNAKPAAFTLNGTACSLY